MTTAFDVRSGDRRSTILRIAAMLIIALALESHAAHAQFFPDTLVEFQKNSQDPTRSVLRVYDHGQVVKSWRAGSGHAYDARHGKDDCAVSVGWIPSGFWMVDVLLPHAYPQIPSPAFHLLGLYNRSYGSPQWSNNPHPCPRQRGGFDIHIASDFTTAGCIGVARDKWSEVEFTLNVYRWVTHNGLLVWVH